MNRLSESFFRPLTSSRSALLVLLLTTSMVLTFSGKSAYAQTPGGANAGNGEPVTAVEGTLTEQVVETPNSAAQSVTTPSQIPVPVSPVTPLAPAVEEKEVVVVEAQAAPAEPVVKEVKETVEAKPEIAANEEKEPKWYDMISVAPWMTARVTANFINPGLEPCINSAGVKITGVYGPFELVISPEFRQTKNRSFFTSNIVLKEAFLQWTPPVDGLTIKGGLVYNQFGMFWDDSFFGNQMLLIGYKLNADYNLEVAWKKQFTSLFGLETWFQFSPGQDGTNLSVPELYQANYETAGDFEASEYFTTLMALRLHIVPSLTFGDFKVKPGISMEYKWVHRDASSKVDKKNPMPKPAEKGKKDVQGKVFTEVTGTVFAADTELSLYWKDFRFTTEFMGQFTGKELAFKGREVKRFIIASSLHAPVYDAPNNDWFLNAAVNLGLSYSIFKTEEVDRLEMFAGFTTQLYKYIDIQVEYGGYWTTRGEDPGADKTLTSQVEFLLTAKF